MGIHSVLTFSFCIEVGHTATKGPANSQLIQYLRCEKITKMTPQARFQGIQKQNFVFSAGPSMNIFCEGNKSPVQEVFSKIVQAIYCPKVSGWAI